MPDTKPVTSGEVGPAAPVPVSGAEPEGWTFLYNSPKWHYFRKSRSLCGRWLYLGSDDALEQGNDNSSDNCPTCKKTLLKNPKKAIDNSVSVER